MSDINNHSLKAEGILLFTTLLWGGTFTVTKVGLQSVPPFMLIGLRFGIAFLIFTAVWHRRLPDTSRMDLLRGVILGALMFLGYGLQTAGLSLTTVAKSSLFTYTFAIYVPPLQYIIGGKKINAGTGVGIVLAMAGIYLFSSPDTMGLNLGDILTLLSAFAFGWQIVLLDIYAKKSDPVKLTAIQFALVAIVGIVIAFSTGRTAIRWDLPFIFSVGYLAIIGSVVAIYLMNRYQHETTPAKAVVIYAMEPVFSVIIGALVLHEVLGAREFLGGALIILGVTVSELWSAITGRYRSYD